MKASVLAIKLSKSVVGNREKASLGKVIDESYLGMGNYVNSFELKLKEYLGAKNVLCVNSGTAALHLSLMAAGILSNHEVLVQSITYISSFQAISAVGATPVPCEVLPGTCTIDLADAEKKVTDRTKAIMPVHYGGRVGNLKDIYKFADNYNLRVIEDAAHAFGTEYKGRKIGSFGDIVCFSFDGIKNITSGEGGAVATSDEEVARFLSDGRLLGVVRDTEKRFSGGRSWEFDVLTQGYRYHMSNLFASIGIVQLERFQEEFKEKRQSMAAKYHEELSGIDGLILFPNDYDEVVPHIFPIRVLNGERDGLRQFLLDNKIECGVHYYPNHLLSYYGNMEGKLPVSEKLYEELLTIPLHPDISMTEQEYIIEKTGSYFEKLN
jgi:dTDP-4-amino-4,6-dideoxygalactose transaminase